MDIKLDIEVSKRSLEREAYKAFASDAWLLDFDFDKQRADGKAPVESGGV